MLVLLWVRERREVLAVVLVALVAAVTYSSFSWGLPWRFNSPDEAANAYFSERMALGQELAAPAALNAVVPVPVVHPRSTTIVDGRLVPASFLGLPLLAGFVGRFAGTAALPYVTPLGAVVGLVCFYLIVRGLFNPRAAAIAFGLLALLPGYWYYHSRSFFHNGLFFDFLLLTFWLGLKALRSGRSYLYLLTGLAYGATVALRSSEVFWITVAVVVWVTTAGYKVHFRHLVWFVAGAVVGFSPVLITNYHLYGQPLSIGYGVSMVQPGGSLSASASLLKQLIVPFGIHPHVIWSNVSRYLITLSWWWTVLAAVGAAWVASHFRTFTQEQRAWFSTTVVAAVWLTVLYGSWQFHDNPDPTAITLGTSYVRYWLPLQALLLIPAALAADHWLSVRWARVGVAVALVAYAALSVHLVLFDPSEGLNQVRANIFRFESISLTVQRLTDPKSVIMTELTDKFFWPERAVMQSSPPQVTWPAVKTLLKHGTPVFYFHPTWSPRDFTLLNQKQLAPYGLGLQAIQYGFGDHSLYRFAVTKL